MFILFALMPILFLPVIGMIYICCYTIYGFANGRKVTPVGWIWFILCLGLTIRVFVR